MLSYRLCRALDSCCGDGSCAHLESDAVVSMLGWILVQTSSQLGRLEKSLLPRKGMLYGSAVWWKHTLHSPAVTAWGEVAVESTFEAVHSRLTRSDAHAFTSPKGSAYHNAEIDDRSNFQRSRSA